jgi:hypothetical protein
VLHISLLQLSVRRFFCFLERLIEEQPCQVEVGPFICRIDTWLSDGPWYNVRQVDPAYALDLGT